MVYSFISFVMVYSFITGDHHTMVQGKFTKPDAIKLRADYNNSFPENLE